MILKSRYTAEQRYQKCLVILPSSSHIDLLKSSLVFWSLAEQVPALEEKETKYYILVIFKKYLLPMMSQLLLHSVLAKLSVSDKHRLRF